jgi:hypothetical protein
MAYEIRARSVGEILDGAFQLYRNHFATFFGAAVLFSLPSLIAAALINWALVGTASAVPSPQVALGRAFSVIFITLPVFFVSHILQSAVLTIAIADAYLGRPVSLGAALRRTVALLGPLVGSSVLTGLGSGFAMVLLIIPGIWLMLRWLFTVQAITVEGCGAVASLERSSRLTNGRLGTLFGLVLLFVIINWALALGFGAVIPDSVSAFSVIGSVLRQLPEIVLAPIYPGVITLSYFDVRVRKEAFDLEMLSRGIGGTAPAAASAAAPMA